MKDNARMARILLMGLLTLGVIVYFAVEAWRYFANPITTALAYPYEIEESVDMTGFVVRQETLLPAAGDGFLRVSRAEGERVSAGGVAAQIYAGQRDLDRTAEIDALSGWLEQLREAKLSTVGAQATARIDSRIFAALAEYRGDLASGRLDQAEAVGDTLKALVPRRENLPGDTEGLNREIAAAELRLEELSSQDAPSVRNITAPVSGLYSGAVDGYEGVLTPAMLSGVTPSVLSNVEPAETGNAVGKLVLGREWYYAAVIPAASAKTLREHLGSELRLRFSRGVERDFPVILDTISGEENGLVAVVFRGTTYLSEVTQLRQQSAQVVTSTAEGLRVPKEALRMESGGEQRTGLFCVVGNQERFKAVEVLYRGEEYLLVQADPAAKENLRLRAGDEVIVRGVGLEDGKVLP